MSQQGSSIQTRFNHLPLAQVQSTRKLEGMHRQGQVPSNLHFSRTSRGMTAELASSLAIIRIISATAKAAAATAPDVFAAAAAAAAATAASAPAM